MIDVGGPTSLKTAPPLSWRYSALQEGRVSEQWEGSQPVSSIPSWSLNFYLQVPIVNSCLGFPQCVA